MTAWIGKRFTGVFRILPGEGQLVFVLGLILFCNSLAQQLAGIVSVSGFLSTNTVNSVLLVWLIDMTSISVIIALQSLVIDRLSRRKLLSWVMLAFALVYLLLRVMFALHVSESIIYGVMFIFADAQFVVFPLAFWTLANDIADTAQARRIFPVVAGQGFLGRIVGILIALVSPPLLAAWRLPQEEVLTFSSIVYLLSLLLVLGLQRYRVRKISFHKETLRETIGGGWNFIREVSSFRYLMLAEFAIGICLTVIEFRFLGVGKAAFPDQAAYQQFYSLYRLALALISWVFQTFLTSRLISSMGLRNAFLVMPITMIVCSLWLLVQPVVAGAVGAMILARLVQKAVDESASTMYQGLVPEEQRGRVSILVASYPPVIGTIAGALLAGAVVLGAGALHFQQDYLIYLLIPLAAGLAALFLVLNMRRVYEISLLNWRMKRRQRATSLLNKIEF